MFKLVFLLITLITFNFDVYGQDQVGLPEDLYPNLPDPLPHPPPPPEFGIQKDIKGIIVTEPTGELWRDEFRDFQGVKIVGLTVPGGAEQLKNRLVPYLGKPLSVEVIETIKWEILSYYKEHGGIDVFVEMTQDYVSTGVLELIVIEPFSNLKSKP